MKLFVKDLTVIDSSVLDYSRGIIGQSWLVDIVLHGDLNEQSMILDFGIVKKLIKSTVDELVDHKLIVPAHAKFCDVMSDGAFTYVDAWREHSESIHLACPDQAFALIPAEQITLANLEAYLTEQLMLRLPNNVKKLDVKLREEKIDGAEYCYSHGLRKHLGNCQRIAHGHRSTIEILRNDERDPALEASWAERWKDIYLAEHCDMVSVSEVSLSRAGMAALTPEHYCFKYQAPQGEFQLAISKSIVEIMPTETTVENIAQYIADTLAKDCSDSLTVFAYEGVGKGAIASA
ncbi:6-carboxytetrahydropterin synthase [Moritella sp. 5]|uniref:6-carboxytetrahydropterin synthase n=1 Tax=Moritella sp. 5 TaxID=2746231 RepID=UPI001BAB2023|nr:6-carboxytetrahydropterin synthase [Moritella sp. 5]QUM79985.1 6-carboxytetrahydropterin synthase [Moritella sp. 5]